MQDTSNIEAVVDRFAPDLIAISGVVGVYAGIMDDDRTLCIKIMVDRLTPELKTQLPTVLEGYPVIPEESGIIRPL